MNVFFISDDSFLLLGIQECGVWKMGCQTFFININEDNPPFIPARNDVVVLAINDISQRKTFMDQQELHHNKVMMIVNAPVENTTSQFYPWLIRKNIKPKELIFFINKASHNRERVEINPLIVKEIFTMLGKGLSMRKLTTVLNLPEKYIYQVKRNIIRRYGLYNCNAAGVLICRDIICAIAKN